MLFTSVSCPRGRSGSCDSISCARYQENPSAWSGVQLDIAGPGSHSAALCDEAHAEPWEQLRRKKPQTQEGPLGGTQERKRQPAAVGH